MSTWPDGLLPAGRSHHGWGMILTPSSRSDYVEWAKRAVQFPCCLEANCRYRRTAQRKDQQPVPSQLDAELVALMARIAEFSQYVIWQDGVIAFTEITGLYAPYAGDRAIGGLFVGVAVQSNADGESSGRAVSNDLNAPYRFASGPPANGFQARLSEHSIVCSNCSSFRHSVSKQAETRETIAAAGWVQQVKEIGTEEISCRNARTRPLEGNHGDL